MKLHLITNLFAPDELAGAALFTDLARFFRDRGHEVRVTTTFSYYPAWKLRDEDRGVVWREEVFESIPVRRVAMRVPREASASGRLLADASFLWSLLRRGVFREWTPDVVLTASPMFSQCLAQRFLYPGKRVPRMIVVQDFVVDAALDLGILRAPGLRGLLLALERWAFASASTLLTISPEMLLKLQDKMGQTRRAVLVPNWIHRSLAEEVRRQSKAPANRCPGLLLYAGNVGRKQGLPEFAQQFSRVTKGWSLQIHGGGAEAASLRQVTANSQCIRVGGVLEEPAYVAALRHAAACLVTQRAGVGANFLPSKLLPALATGTPVLAVCDAGSPLGREVVEGGFGEVIPPGDPGALRSVLARWLREPAVLEQFSVGALERSLLYKGDNVLPKYEEELLILADRCDSSPSSP